MSDPTVLISAASGVIAATAFAAAIVILYFLLKKPEFRYRTTGLLLCALLFACGTAHVCGVLNIWQAAVWPDALARSATALISVVVALLVLPSVPRLLSLPSPSSLARANALLGQEISVRSAAEENLRLAHSELEQRIRERTGELVAANERLELEIRDRRQIQDTLYQAIEEREALLREVHHRVKNNLQMMTSFLNLQIRGETSVAMRQKLREMQARINALSIVHKKLYGGTDIAAVDVGGLLAELAKQLGVAYRTEQNGIRLEVHAQPLYTDMDHAIPLALLTTEAVTNALKYAFPEGRGGTIAIDLTQDDASTILRIKDDGIGWAKDAEKTSATQSSGLGLTLMRGMARQLDGNMEMKAEEGEGVEIEVAMKTESLAVKRGIRKSV